MDIIKNRPKLVFLLVLVLIIIIAGCVQKQEKKESIPIVPLEEKPTIVPPEVKPQVQVPLTYNKGSFIFCGDPCTGEKAKEFEEQCSDNNGISDIVYQHPSTEVIGFCYQKAPDTGKECSSGNDCQSGFCNLRNGIDSKKCTLIKKEVTGRLGTYGDETYNANYSCTTNKPGICSATKDLSDPYGIERFFTMKGTVLIEVVEEGPVT